MNASLLPPRGIFVPTQMIFNTQLPSAVLVTWIQLRCLAWRGWATPPMSIPELASLIGIHPNRLQKQLAQLEGQSALTCRSTRDGKLVVAFPEKPPSMGENQSVKANLPVVESTTRRERESPSVASYFPDRIMGYVSYQEDQDGFEITHDLNALNVELEKAANCS